MALCMLATSASFFREPDCPAECRKFGSSTNGYCNDGYAPEKEHRSINWTPKLHLKSRDLRTTCSQLRLKLLSVRRSSTCLVSCWEQKTSELTGGQFFGGNLAPFSKWRPDSLDVKSPDLSCWSPTPIIKVAPNQKREGCFHDYKGVGCIYAILKPVISFPKGKMTSQFFYPPVCFKSGPAVWQ